MNIINMLVFNLLAKLLKPYSIFYGYIYFSCTLHQCLILFCDWEFKQHPSFIRYKIVIALVQILILFTWWLHGSMLPEEGIKSKMLSAVNCFKKIFCVTLIQLYNVNRTAICMPYNPKRDTLLYIYIYIFMSTILTTLDYLCILPCRQHKWGPLLLLPFWGMWLSLRFMYNYCILIMIWCGYPFSLTTRV